jgi:hypothetical protein
MKLFTLGIDLANTEFHLAEMNQPGKWWCGSAFSRTHLCTSPRT